MKRNWITLLVFLTLASVGRAQVVLPSSSDYHDPYNYFRDCVDRNGVENEGVCEQQTGALFPDEDKTSEGTASREDDLAYN